MGTTSVIAFGLDLRHPRKEFALIASSRLGSATIAWKLQMCRKFHHEDDVRELAKWILP
jgi:hypothetical protein